MALTAEEIARLRQAASKAEKPAAQIPVRPQKPGFVSSVMEGLRKRDAEASSALAQGVRGEISGPEAAVRILGQAAAIPGDVIGQAITSGYRSLVPEAAKPAVERSAGQALAETVGQAATMLIPQALRPGIGRQVAGAVSGAFPQAASQAIEGYQSFAQQNPRVAKTLEGVVNIASAIPVGKGVRIVGKAVKEGSEEALEQAARAGAKRAVSMMDREFDDMFLKAVKPPSSQMASPQMTKAYLDKAKKAVNAVIQNEPDLKLMDEAGEAVKVPQSLKQFSDAIGQTKKSIFKKYSSQATAAGQKGAIVDLNGTADELLKMSDNVVLQDKDPDLIKYIKDKADKLKKRGAYTPEQAEDAIRVYNESLEAFYRQPSYDTASRATADAVVVNNLRKGLDAAISSLEGPGYQELKNVYGALSTIERDVAKRAGRVAGLNAKGLLDFTDIATGAGAVEAILNMSPSRLAASATAAGIKRIYKHLNDPNEIVKRMFKNVKKTQERALKYGMSKEGSKLVPMKSVEVPRK